MCAGGVPRGTREPAAGSGTEDSRRRRVRCSAVPYLLPGAVSDEYASSSRGAPRELGAFVGRYCAASSGDHRGDAHQHRIPRRHRILLGSMPSTPTMSTVSLARALTQALSTYRIVGIRSRRPSEQSSLLSMHRRFRWRLCSRSLRGTRSILHSNNR